MMLYQVSNVSRRGRFLMASILICSLTACVPSMQTIYHTPVVTGQVIDLATFKPIEGVVVMHEGKEESSNPDITGKTPKEGVLTNQAGDYYLPSQSSRELTILMVGHAIADYPVRISNNNHSALVIVQASMKMLSEESAMAPPLILDQDPETIAQMPVGDYLKYKQLQEFLAPQGIFAGCDPELGADALTSLNTARKIY